MRYRTIEGLLHQHGWSSEEDSEGDMFFSNGDASLWICWDDSDDDLDDAYVLDDDGEACYICKICYLRFFDDSLVIDWNDGDEWTYWYDEDDSDDSCDDDDDYDDGDSCDDLCDGEYDDDNSYDNGSDETERRTRQSQRDRSNSHNPNNQAYRNRMNQKANSHNPNNQAYWDRKKQSYNDRNRR